MGYDGLTMPSWTWAAASAVGTSHTRAGRGSDDSAACLHVPKSEGQVLVVAVSDGAGSAKLSKRGSSIAVHSFCRSARVFVKAGGELGSLTDETVRDWVDNIRDRINYEAGRVGAAPRDFAATLVGCVAWAQSMVVVHIGDGACVYRQEDSANWEVASWPRQGEFASTTFFLTDDPEPQIQINRLKHRVNEIAVFTDGLERLALEFATTTAFPGFFNAMFQPLRAVRSGRDRQLSRQLKEFLNSDSVNQRTDDDKSLVLACRRRSVP